MNENTPTDLQPGEYRVEGYGAVVRVTSHNTFGSTFDWLIWWSLKLWFGVWR